MRKAAAVAMALAAFPALGSEPVRIVFDTDMGNDVDDALALGVIHSLQSRRCCELLAATSSKDHPKSAAFIDSLNTFYGRPDVPVGAVRDGVTRAEGSYLKLADVTDGDRLRYPHSLASGAEAPEAVSLLRRVLAGQPDGSVVLTQVGFFTNYSRLLASGADDASALSGVELVRRKVRLLVVMAGAFEPIQGKARYLEYNVVQDIPSAQRLADGWPTPIVWSGYEIGIAAPYPAASIERDYSYVPHHPLRDAYMLYSPPPHNRPTWDLTVVLYAVLPDRGYFELSAPGRVTVEQDGFTRFDPAASGRDRCLILPEPDIGRLTEALVQLSSQPPLGDRHAGRGDAVTQ